MYFYGDNVTTTDEAALGCSQNMYTRPCTTPVREHGDPPLGGDIKLAPLHSVKTKSCASWHLYDARPQVFGMILLVLPISGPVDLSSL